MKQRILRALAIFILALSFCQPAFAAPNYDYSLDYDTSEVFGKPTTSEVAPDYSHIENTRKNKDAALYPPPYATFSGAIPTNPTSNYHEQDRVQSAASQVTSTGFWGESFDGFSASTSIDGGSLSQSLYETGQDNVTVNYIASGSSSSANNSNYNSSTRIVTVEKYSDGSIGRLVIPDLGIEEKVYDGTSQDIMRKGIGHFDNTSMWDGNVSLASHNRGSASFFRGIWNLDDGARITYTTKEGSRTYAVYNIFKIDETDFSVLASSNDNILTLITCVENSPSQRWCVQAREVL